MAKVYADLIRKGIKTIEDVPGSLVEAVKMILDNERSGEMEKDKRRDTLWEKQEKFMEA